MQLFCLYASYIRKRGRFSPVELFLIRKLFLQFFPLFLRALQLPETFRRPLAEGDNIFYLWTVFLLRFE